MDNALTRNAYWPPLDLLSEVNSSLFFLASDLCHPDDLMATPFNILVHHHPATTLPGPAATQQLQHYEAPQVDPSSYGTPLPRGLPSGEPIAGGSGSVFRPQIEQMGAPEGGYGGVRQDQLPPLSSLDLPSTSSRATTSQHPDMGRRIQPPEIGGGSHQHAQHPYYAQVAGSSSMGLPGGGGGPSLTAVASESYTRNLVGSSVASASVLYDEQNQPGIFFTLQDISVRTEGVYRIKLMFANLGL